VVLLEEEVGRKQEIIKEASHVQADLSEKLSMKQRMLEEKKQKFHRFAQRANIGIFITTSSGEYTFRNDRWFEIFHFAKDELDLEGAWKKLVEPSELHCCDHAWERLTTEQVPVSFELRLNRTWEKAKSN
jgi:PAS domain-containing protein